MNVKLVLFVNLVAVIACDQIHIRHSIDEDQNGNRSQRKNKRKDRKRKKEEKWVVDSIFYDDYQSDGPSPTQNYDFCPPVPDVIDESACAKDTCKSDLDCGKSFRCCFNGCAYSCLFEVQPAPVVDWLKEPRRSRSGISWLLPDKKPVINEAESCTTGPFESDEDPLLCPHGYFCYVDTHRKGRKKKKLNTGYCVKQVEDQYSPGETEMALTAALRGRRICHVDGIVLLDGASIRLNDKKCNCKRGYLSCTPNKPNTVDVKLKENSQEKTRKRENRARRKRRKNKNKFGRPNKT